MNFSQSTNGVADIKNRRMDKGGGGEGEGEMNGESSLETFALIYIS